MGLSEENIEADPESSCAQVTTAKKRRLRRKKLRAAKSLTSVKINIDHNNINVQEILNSSSANIVPKTQIFDYDTTIKSEQNKKILEVPFKNTCIEDKIIEMSSKEGSVKTRDDVMAAREAKKQAKQKAKLKNIENKDNVSTNIQPLTSISDSQGKKNISTNVPPKKPVTSDKIDTTPSITAKAESPKSKDEVDRAIQYENIDINKDKSKELIKSERAAKKAAKQAKKKPIEESGVKNTNVTQDLTVKDVVNTLKDIVNVAKDVQAVTDKVIAIDFTAKKSEESTKSKAELRAERRAKQEAQRASKQAAQQQKPSEVKTERPSKDIDKTKEEKSTKAKPAVEKSKPKSQGMQKMNWFQHLYTEHDKDSLKQMAINSNLHPAVIKLGVQLASRVVTGSNARCIALLDALKKMVKDYSLPARTEFARGLEAQLAASVEFLWAVRPPAASQTNALKYFRYHLTQLPNNVDEFDAKKRLQEEIDRYIREQIDMAGEAISIAVRNKISTNDNILTYGCSSLIERILCEAQAAGVVFRAVVVGTRLQRGAREMLRRLLARGVRCSYADISALNYLMRDVNKVLVGAASLLANGAVLAPAGTLQAALAARAHNVPLLVACETHKFADTVQTDAFVHNEIGDPDDLIDKNDENSPLKDWRTNPNLSLLNLMYDVTPPSLVTAVVTELAILPCTSAPVVLRFKLSEYGL
ncbi:translation initiation factor eIF-2B subunit delta [Nymphalis io]|uniref:translation initiation factor eIF-2B subunit delta n=1 Tax=Inachis io TaxID=171585 RepID=UPI002169218D|nr:translation initiation factor eIF-2B subunit delta [Nymphalis io]XP_050343130.1 translation initiation factor eIF-2B subunit delta [Nymphalis io]